MKLIPFYVFLLFFLTILVLKSKFLNIILFQQELRNITKRNYLRFIQENVMEKTVTFFPKLFWIRLDILWILFYLTNNTVWKFSKVYKDVSAKKVRICRKILCCVGICVSQINLVWERYPHPIRYFDSCVFYHYEVN